MFFVIITLFRRIFKGEHENAAKIKLWQNDVH